MVGIKMNTVNRLTQVKWKGFILYNNALTLVVLDFLEPQKVGTEKVNDRISGIVQCKLDSNLIQSTIYVGIWNGLGYDILIDNLANTSNLTTFIKPKQHSFYIEGFGHKQQRVIFKPF